MKKAAIAILLALPSAMIGAQTTGSSADVTIKMSPGSPSYCLGPSGAFATLARGPNDITLTLPLKLRYENHRSEGVILPSPYHYVVSATVVGQSTPISKREGSGGSGTTDVNSPLFSFMRVEGAEPSAGLDLRQCLAATDPGCISDFIPIPVLDRSSGLDLRGKTVQIVTTRDHSLPSDMVAKLSNKVKASEIIWARVVESEMMTFRISDEPLTRSCR
jgi:hypothetical protein